MIMSTSWNGRDAPGGHEASSPENAQPRTTPQITTSATHVSNGSRPVRAAMARPVELRGPRTSRRPRRETAGVDTAGAMTESYETAPSRPGSHAKRDPSKRVPLVTRIPRRPSRRWGTFGQWSLDSQLNRRVGALTNSASNPSGPTSSNGQIIQASVSTVGSSGVARWARPRVVSQVVRPSVYAFFGKPVCDHPLPPVAVTPVALAAEQLAAEPAT